MAPLGYGKAVLCVDGGIVTVRAPPDAWTDEMQRLVAERRGSAGAVSGAIARALEAEVDRCVRIHASNEFSSTPSVRAALDVRSQVVACGRVVCLFKYTPGPAGTFPGTVTVWPVAEYAFLFGDGAVRRALESRGYGASCFRLASS